MPDGEPGDDLEGAHNDEQDAQQGGKDSFEVLDTTSNKFSLAAFWL